MDVEVKTAEAESTTTATDKKKTGRPPKKAKTDDAATADADAAIAVATAVGVAAAPAAAAFVAEGQASRNAYMLIYVRREQVSEWGLLWDQAGTLPVLPERLKNLVADANARFVRSSPCPPSAGS